MYISIDIILNVIKNNSLIFILLWFLSGAKIKSYSNTVKKTKVDHKQQSPGALTRLSMQISLSKHLYTVELFWKSNMVYRMLCETLFICTPWTLKLYCALYIIVLVHTHTHTRTGKSHGAIENEGCESHESGQSKQFSV